MWTNFSWFDTDCTCKC